MRFSVYAFAVLVACCLWLPVHAAPVPTATPLAVTTGIVLRDANLRTGPAVTYKRIGVIKAQTSVNIIGANPKGDWYQLDTKAWIAASLVQRSPATITPTPSITLTITPTTTSLGLSYVEQSYLEETQTHTIDLANALRSLGRLLQNPQITSDDWKIDVAVQIVIISNVDDAINQIPPPPRFAGVHLDLIEVTGICRSAAVNAGRAIDTLDTDIAALATDQMTLCGQKAVTLTQKLKLLTK